MSTAARKARKRYRHATIEAAAEVSDTVTGRQQFVEAEAPAFQHPRREGIPRSRRGRRRADFDAAAFAAATRWPTPWRP